MIGRQLWMYHGELSRLQRGLVGGQPLDRLGAGPGQSQLCHRALRFQVNAAHQVTTGFYNDELPVFDPDGKYLFFRTGRSFGPATAIWTIPGFTPTPCSSPPCRCARTSSPRSRRAMTRKATRQGQEGGRPEEEGRGQVRQEEGRRQERREESRGREAERRGQVRRRKKADKKKTTRKREEGRESRSRSRLISRASRSGW